jgi:hypothetical protein
MPGGPTINDKVSMDTSPVVPLMEAKEAVGACKERKVIIYQLYGTHSHDVFSFYDA